MKEIKFWSRMLLMVAMLFAISSCDIEDGGERTAGEMGIGSIVGEWSSPSFYSSDPDATLIYVFGESGEFIESFTEIGYSEINYGVFSQEGRSVILEYDNQQSWYDEKWYIYKSTGNTLYIYNMELDSWEEDWADYSEYISEFESESNADPADWFLVLNRVK
ncbi:MAG: hypothetical protein SNG35_08495 [Rikenellaceae bacterium]